jgi:hypothetical protein
MPIELKLAILSLLALMSALVWSYVFQFDLAQRRITLRGLFCLVLAISVALAMGELWLRSIYHFE